MRKTLTSGLLAMTFGGLTADRPGQAPAAAAVVLGQVVDGTTSQPVPEAIVTVTPADAVGGGSPAARAAASRKVIADDTGRFVFTRLPAGSYRLSAMKPGFVPGTYGQLVPRGAGSPLQLAEGQRVVDARILVWKYGVVTGRVIDDAGEPIVGVEVKVLRRTSTGGRAGFSDAASAKTDDRGVYRVASLAPGGYVVGVPSVATTIPAAMIDAFLTSSGPAHAEMQQALFVAAPTMTDESLVRAARIGDHLVQVDSRMTLSPRWNTSGISAVFPTTFHPQASLPENATLIMLDVAEIRGAVDIPLRAVAARRIAGALRGATGPVGLAAVQLFPASASQRFATPVATTVADASGAFVFYGVPEGNYELRVVKLPADPAAAPGPPSGPTLWGTRAVAVGGDDVGNLEIALASGVQLSGRIVIEGRPPAVPIQRMQPLLESLDRWLLAAQSEIVVAADGRFSSYEVPPGSYRFSVPSPSGWFLKSAIAGGRDLASLPFELQESVTDIVVTISDRGARVSGTVRGETSAPDSTAAIVLFSTDSRQWMDFSSYARDLKDTRTDRTGSYAIGDLPAGEYFVVAVRQRDLDWTQPSFFASLSRVATRISLREGEQRALDLRTTPIKWER